MNGCRRVRPRWSTVGRTLVARASVRLARPQNTRSFHGPAFAHAAFAHSTGGSCGKGPATSWRKFENAIHKGRTGDEIYSFRICLPNEGRVNIRAESG